MYCKLYAILRMYLIFSYLQE